MTAARLGPAVLLAALLLLTAVAGLQAADRVGDRRREAVDRAAAAAVDAIDRRMQAYGEVLYGTAALFEASDDVSHREFHQAIAGQRVAERYPGVQVIGFAEHVGGGDVAAFARREGRASRASGLAYPPLRIRPAGRRGERVVIDRIEPQRTNEAAYGFDFLAEPARRAAVLRTRRTDLPAGTAPVRLVQETGSQQGFLVMLRVDRGGRFAGVAYAAFRIGDLLRGVLGPVGRDVDLEISDGGRRFYDLDPASRPDDEHARRLPLDVAGRRWSVTYARHGGDVVSATERAAPWAILVAGVLVSLLAAALLRSLTGARRRADRLVALRTRELRRSNEELEHFAYLASHDLQEPLRTVTAYVGLLRQRLGGQLDERSATWLGYVGDGAARMSTLIADLLEYSRVGRREPQPGPTDLDEAWDTAVANLEEAIRDSGAQVRRGDLPVVRAGRAEMTSLLQNLLANALKYRGQAPPAVRADAVRADGVWEVRVADNGIGVDPRFHDRIFGLFQRLHTNEEYPGSGMGLAIVRKLAEAHGGTVHVESTPGEGATFVVRLPAEDRA